MDELTDRPSELSAIGRIMKALKTARTLHCGADELDYFDVIELVGHIESLEEDANLLRVEFAERDALIKKLVDALEELMDGFEIRGDVKLDALVSEGKAAK